MALKQDLRLIRQSIERYTLEQQDRPQSLDELVSAGYLGEIPVDPLTRRKDWRGETAEVALQLGQTSGGNHRRAFELRCDFFQRHALQLLVKLPGLPGL